MQRYFPRWFPLFGPHIFDALPTFLTPKKEGGIFYQGGDLPLTAKLCIEPSKWSEFFSFTPSYGVKELTNNHHTALKRFSCCLNKFCFFVIVALISFIRGNFQYLNLVELLKGQCPDYAHARASAVFSSKDNRTVILTRQDFLPDRTADGDLLFTISSSKTFFVLFKIWLAARRLIAILSLGVPRCDPKISFRSV